MLIAIKNKNRISAKPKDIAHCPICRETVISKCGKINVWHWSHISKKDCDDWYEPESKWHIEWKEQFPLDTREIIIGEHRADIKTKKTIIELQSSSISTYNIQKRENFYNDMIWLLNGGKYGLNFDIRKTEKKYYTFRWKFPHKCWWDAKKPIFIDLHPIRNILFNNLRVSCDREYILWASKRLDLYSNNIFAIKKIYKNCPCGGWGYIISKEEFINKLM